MAKLDLTRGIKLRESFYAPPLNTGLPFDTITGRFIPGTAGNVILEGGLALTDGTQGKAGSYKSSQTDAKAANVFSRYSDTVWFKYDTEGHTQRERVLDMSTIDIPMERYSDFKVIFKATHYLEDFYYTMLEIANRKVANIKDYIREAPFYDPETGKPARVIVPTIVTIDSISNAPVKSTMDLLQPGVSVNDDGYVESDAEGREMNTLAMKEALMKQRILKELVVLAERAGLYLIVTSHMTDKIDMGYIPTPKEMQYQPGNDKTKGAPKDFKFLMMNLFTCLKAEARLDSSKTGTLYPSANSIIGAMDLNEVYQLVTKCKTNAAGGRFTSMVSQAFGFDPILTNYHYLKEQKFGIEGDPSKRHSLYLDKNKTVLQRTTVSDTLRNDPKMARIVEILYQLCYIQRNWTIRNMKVPFNISPMELADKLHSSSIPVDDILSSRGWWTYDKVDQPYLSLFDILAIASGKYTPVLFPSKTSTVVPLKKAA